MLHSSEQLWPWLRRLYWNSALFVGVILALPQLWMGEWVSQAVAGAYLLASVVAYPLAYRYPQPAPVLHLVATLAMLVWASHQPWEAVVPGWDREMALYASATLATLGLTVLALFGGIWVMIGGLVMLAVLMPHPDSVLYWLVLPGWALAGMVGLALFQAIHKLEATQQELAKVALRDRHTGLSTRLALETDYERYQALASRSDQPLLLSYWVLRTEKQSPEQNLQLAQKLAQIMREAVRQGDGLYHLEDNHFCGLHIGLVSGHELTERLSRRIAQAHRLVYYPPLRPLPVTSDVPKA